jgi:hypothetical protein
MLSIVLAGEARPMQELNAIAAWGVLPKVIRFHRRQQPQQIPDSMREVWPVMRRHRFHEHTDNDTIKSRDLRYRLSF